MEKVYDNIFKSMVTKNPHLLIPLINEVFDEDYDIETNVVLLSDEHQTETGDGLEDDGEVITDSYILIEGDAYHLECQSNPDGTIVFRMIEYDFHIALDDALRNGNRDILFPKSAVLYLRHNSKTEDVLHLNIILPNGPRNDGITYDVPIIKVMDISKEEIIRKRLYFLAPYYIMRVEKGIPAEEVLDDYMDIVMAMVKDHQRGYFVGYDLLKVQRHFEKLVNSAYSDIKNARGAVEAMGGKVIYDDIDKAYDEAIERGKKQGIEQGKELTRVEAIKNLMKNLNLSAQDAMASLGIPESEYAKYLELI